MNCVICGGILTGRQRKFCSSWCKKQEARRAHLWKTYRITPEDYEVIFAFQGGACYICGRRPTTGTFLHIDHEHGGHVRGLLCGYCNTRLVGRLKNHDTAQRLADYLRDPPAVKALGKQIKAPGRPRKKRRRHGMQ